MMFGAGNKRKVVVAADECLFMQEDLVSVAYMQYYIEHQNSTP